MRGFAVDVDFDGLGEGEDSGDEGEKEGASRGGKRLHGISISSRQGDGCERRRHFEDHGGSALARTVEVAERRAADMAGKPTEEGTTADQEKTEGCGGLEISEPEQASRTGRLWNMAQTTSPATKTFSFGSCRFGRTSPVLEVLSPSTRILHIEINFEEALKLNLAISECVRKLNSYNRSKTDGKRSGLNVAVHLGRRVITINEARLPKGKGMPGRS